MSRAKAKRRATPPAIGELIETQRQRLFQAHAIVEVTRFAFVSQLEGLDEAAVTSALQLAGAIIDEVAAALEPRGV